MQRRTLIRQLVFTAAAAAILPSCLQDKSKSSMLLKKISVDGDQEKMLADLAEALIPKTDTPGAKDISAHLFVLLMVDDCYKAEDQQKFVAGLKALEEKISKQWSKSFSELSAPEKETLLKELDGKKTGNEEIAYCYSTIKKLTIQAYTTSQFYLTKVQVYELVPGRYEGCVPVSSLTKKVA